MAVDIKHMNSTVLLLDDTSRAVSTHLLSAGRLRRAVVGLGVLWLAVWVFAVVFLWTAQSQLVFNTAESHSYTSAFDSRIFIERSFTTADGLRLESIQLTHEPAQNSYWILFCPPAGASTRVRRIQEQLEQLWSLGYNVLAFDYRGFGDNGGTPSEAGLYADADAAYTYLVSNERVRSERIVIAGRSLGASVALDVATRVDSGGVLLFSPIDSIPEVASRLYPWAPVRWLARYHFDNRSKATMINPPVILVYGTPDPFMPLSDARSLFAEFRGRKKMLETNGNHHHSGFTDLVQLGHALVDFWPPDARADVPGSLVK